MATNSSAFTPGGRRSCCGTRPMTLRIPPEDRGSLPRTRTEPWEGDVRPHMIRIRDDLPAPLGPSREVRPRPMLAVRPLRATTPPHHLATFLISLTGGPRRER